MYKQLDNNEQMVYHHNLFDTALLDEYLANGVVRQQKHPHLNLFIYSYTDRAQIEGVWDSCTNECRGLIVDGSGQIVARPFRKFHNLNTSYIPESQLSYLVSLDNFESHEITQKLDGSLGIFWRYEGKCGIATRGSFQSEQAKWASEWHSKHVLGVRWPDDYTPLFEILYPENRIVVDYEGFEGLVLLAMVNKRTGEEMDYKSLKYWAAYAGIRVVEKFDKTLDVCMSENTPNEEGYVVTWHRPGTWPIKVKVKFDEYCRLHRIVTHLNPKDVWEMLSMGKDFTPLLTPDMPENFRTWLTEWRDKLQKQHDREEAEAEFICGAAKILFESHPDNLTEHEKRKGYALFFQRQAPRLTGVLFAMLDGKDYHKVIWKMIKPKATDPLRKDGE